MVLEIVVDRKALSVNRPFDYAVPKHLEEVVALGMRVIVNFANKNIIGYVVNIKDSSEHNKLKEIIGILDIIPCFTEELLSLANNMHKYYFCLYVKALETMIPAALRGSYKTIVYKTKEELPKEIDALFKKDELVLESKYNEHFKTILKLVKENKLILEQVVSNKVNIKEKSVISLNEYNIKLNNSQLEIVEYFNTNKQVDKSVLQDIFSVSRVKLLIDKGVLKEEKEEVNRLTIKDHDDKVVELNKEQNEVVDAIKLNSYETYLLHGVTGSGKTEVYLNLIEQVVKQGKEAIMLVPEISLTPQMIERVHGRFKDDVALYHSGLSIGEKYDQYRKIINKEVKIVVGARSAVFTPFSNLGIVIIDEEHESSYKQDVDPRYDARIIARIRAKKHNCPVLLGSATPDIASFYKAQEGTYKLLELKQRANKQMLPKLRVINMLDELKKGNRNLLSNLLKDKIQERIDRNEQTIILLNRRGYSSFITCRDCDESVTCQHCDVSLTYHKSNDTLRCHHCGYSQKNIKSCPSCGSINIRYVGVGTQQVVESLQELFPNENILRMDIDTTSKKNSHEEILTVFKNRESKILVGTQMIAKGLDFPYVTLVGILSADISLKSASFDANEKCFQLITQVAGRAGRHHLDGEVIVQAYDTESYAIELAKTQDYNAFYKRDLTIRKLSNNPPFCDMITIMVSSKNQRQSNQYANMIKQYLLDNTSVKVIGPAEDEILYLNDHFRYKLVIKYTKDSKLSSALENIYLKTQLNKEITISINRS